jgi:nucleotide-binding universal stress UspA family protein
MPKTFERSCLVAPEEAAAVFDRVLCGVDGTERGLVAVRRAARLRRPNGALTVVSVFDVGLAAETGWAATQVAGELRQAAEEALEAARGEVPDATFRLVGGRLPGALLLEATRTEATLVAVGSRDLRRAVGIALGSVTTELLHEAPCSVLVARPASEGAEFPSSIVLGIDGSPESAVAAAAAFDLGRRLGVEVWPVTSTSGKQVDRDAVRSIATGVVFDERRPVDSLVQASSDSDLLVVGSRGLHGMRALGSVSERVAHRAKCSVLVVRPPATQTDVS